MNIIYYSPGFFDQYFSSSNIPKINLVMKKVFFAFLAAGALSSCTEDLTCTCNSPETAYLYAQTDVSQCLGCDSDEADAFRTACDVSDVLYEAIGGDCVID